jgi:hypothetical protein
MQSATPGIRTNLSLSTFALMLAGLASLPARLVISSEQGNGSVIRWAYFFAGLASDIAVTLPAMIALAVALAIEPRKHPRLRALLWLAGLSAYGGWVLCANAAMRFRMERGAAPSPSDLAAGFDVDFFRSEAPAILAGRFAFGNACSVGFGLICFWKRHLERDKFGSRLAPTQLAYTAALTCIMHIISIPVEQFGKDLHNRGALSSPLGDLMMTLLRAQDSLQSPRSKLMQDSGVPASIAAGAKLYGFSEGAAARLATPTSKACTQHPLRTQLDSHDFGWTRAASQVSRALYAESMSAPIVFQVSLESLRSDDIASISASAPDEIAPFLNRIFGVVTNELSGSVAFRHGYQSGIRTGQALGAMICGFGALPFHLALGRDLGSVPLRCLPDVLADAGFSRNAFYGHEFFFDNMAEFLKLHQVALHERREFASDAPRGVWSSVSDASVYHAALANAEQQDRATSLVPQYHFILTLSNHTPFEKPSDMAKTSENTINALCVGRGLTGESCNRLLTLRYADDALGDFIRAISASPIADRALVFAMADHTTHVSQPWAPATQTKGAEAHIPGFLWLSQGLQKRARQADVLQAALEELRSQATHNALSNADVPRLLLALLSASPGLRSLPEVARWHTLGGAATSDAFQGFATDDALWGIDGHSQLFSVQRSGGAMAVDAFVNADYNSTAPAFMAAPEAFWGAFLRSHGHCIQ